jgi:L-fuculose-phosphate aldolase/L-ribulose-5-phosphate 4-epimerase
MTASGRRRGQAPRQSAALRRLKDELVKAARRAYEIGLQTGDGGNLSGRVAGADLIVIKASGFSFGECTPDNLVTVNLKGETVHGDGTPSRELLTHLAIYAARPEILGICHCHGPWSIACAESHSRIPCISLHAEFKLGPIPVLKVAGHGDLKVKKAVEALLAKRPGLKAFVQARHGIFAMAESVTRAEHRAELVEETAQIAWLVAMRTRPRIS